MKVELYHTSTELKQLFRKEKDARLATRIRAVYLAVMGKSAPEIAALLGYRRRAIQNWVYSYNRHGLEGLQDTSGRGQRCKLNADQLQWLRQRLEEGPPPESGLTAIHSHPPHFHLRAFLTLLFSTTYPLYQLSPEIITIFSIQLPLPPALHPLCPFCGENLRNPED